jgi:hypothetical protein
MLRRPFPRMPVGMSIGGSFSASRPSRDLGTVRWCGEVGRARFVSFCRCRVENEKGRISPRMKYRRITADLCVILMTAALAITLARAAEPPPATIDCTFHPVNLPKHGDYSNTKVAPKDMVWLAADDPFIPPNKLSPGLVVWDKNYRQWDFIVLGRGTGHLTPKTDLPRLCIQLANVASEHRANAINYQISGTQIRVQFLRIEEGYFRTAGRQKNLPRELNGNNR